jgi:aspartate/methionine/tyrosine aminotransferase
MRFAARMDNLGTEGAFEVLAQANLLEAAGRDIIHLEIGEPDFPTPDSIVEAAVDALHQGYTHYTPASGLTETRAAVAAFVSRRLGVAVDGREVVIVPGSKNVLLFTLLACVDPGEEVIFPDPGYPAYGSLVEFLGAKPVPIRLREDRSFRMDIAELESLITPKTRLLIVNTPQNPTGGVLTAEDVQQIARLAVERDLLVVCDEIYSQIVYGFEHVSLLAQPGMRERTILMDGMSKAYAMCGWRLGYAVAPAELAARMDTLMINSASCAASFAQIAMIEALVSPEAAAAVSRMVKEFEVRRDVLVDGLNEIPGVRCLRPEGAFYVFPNIEGTGLDDRELADGLLQEAGVAVLSGRAFGQGGAGHLRLAYANSQANLLRALDRIDGYVRARRGAVV